MLTQETKILRALRSHKFGVPNYKFPQMGILRYSARIGDLRKEGYNIYCERDYLPNGKASNVFRYFLIEADNKDGLEYELEPAPKRLSTLRRLVRIKAK